LDDLINGAIGLVIGGFEFGKGLSGLGWRAVEEAVGERTADAFVKQHEE
jgi:hypothetical protein